MAVPIFIIPNTVLSSIRLKSTTQNEVKKNEKGKEISKPCNTAGDSKKVSDFSLWCRNNI